jgi:hypothetical protein
MIGTYDNSALPTDVNHPINKVVPPLIAVVEDVLQANAAVWPRSFPVPPQCNLITGDIDVDGYGGTDVISATCNNDSGANYNTRYVTAVAGQIAALVNAEFASDNFVRFGLPVSKGRTVKFSIGNNNNGKTHVFSGTVAIGTGVAATLPIVHLAWQGEWMGIVPITSLQFQTAGGASMLKGSSIRLYFWKQELNANPGLF